MSYLCCGVINFRTHTNLGIDAAAAILWQIILRRNASIAVILILPLNVHLCRNINSLKVQISMVWFIGLVCLAIGVVVGAAFAGHFNGNPSRIKELENQVKSLEQSHDRYRDDVSDHFNITAELVQQMTESYREVYQHLAKGAQNLCSSDVADKLLPAGSDAAFENVSDEYSGVSPPKDYALKQKPDQLGALSENFGLERFKSGSKADNLP